MNYRRQLDILDPDAIVFPITLIGCGGIGSPTALALAKIGCQNLILIDHDTVEEHNLPNQFFRKSDTGKKKVRACKSMLQKFSDCDVKAIPEKFDNKQNLSGIVISGIDSMQARKEVWERIKNNLSVPLYIDGRIGGEIIQVFTIQPSHIEDIEMYEKALFPDKEAQELPCTARAIMYTGFVVAGLIASQLKKWIMNEQCFCKISFDLKTMSTVLQ